MNEFFYHGLAKVFVSKTLKNKPIDLNLHGNDLIDLVNHENLIKLLLKAKALFCFCLIGL